MNLLDAVKDLMTSESTIWRNNIPITATGATCGIYNIRGRDPDMDLDGVGCRNPSFRVVIRDPSYDAAYGRLDAVILLLVVAKTSSILGIFLEGDIVPIVDKNYEGATLFADFRCKVK